MTILVTGAAGFIGYHVAARLLARGECVLGLDNLNDYYDVALKQARLARLQRQANFRFLAADVADRAALAAVFETPGLDRVVHLAAQAGVRHSIEAPHVYAASNLTGFLHVLEGCRARGVRHLVYASSSSVYGINRSLPFSEHQGADHPASLYGATKKANEAMAHSYAHLYGLPCTGLRFFTVYGPWGRPDMALFLFTRRILAGEPIPVFNRGDHRRDFTYIDDIVEGVVRVLDAPPTADAGWDGAGADAATSSAPWRLFNIGNGRPEPLLAMIATLERALGRRARLELLPAQPGDVAETFADVRDLHAAVGYRPQTPIEAGIGHFVDWYRGFYPT
ncbi:MAG: NAD-dependent epimerase [Pseudomonadota bacterium]|nr:NAD-dependent epimerase [Pseudomonadota bacterium]